MGFRYTTKEIAADFPVTGYVANAPDGSVQLVAEGEKFELEKFLHAMRSSRLSNYFNVAHDRWSDPTGKYATFSIQGMLDYPN